MALRLSDKAQRMLTFLLGLTDGSIAAVLETHGLCQADIDEGWDLLRALGRRQLTQAVSPEIASLKQQLDEWENYWYPIIDAVLARHFPAIHDAVFANLPQVDAEQVPFTLSLLLERLDSLQTETGPLGADGPKALALLDRRRVTPNVLAIPRNLLATLQKFAPDPKASSEEEAARLSEEAERAAWAWYLEWSRIARVAIRNRRLLRKLGYLDARGNTVSEEEETVSEEAASDNRSSESPQRGGRTGTQSDVASRSADGTASANPVRPSSDPASTPANPGLVSGSSAGHAPPKPGMPGGSPFEA